MATLLTAAQQSKVDSLIRLHHASLIVELLGDDAVSPKVLKALHAKRLYRKPRTDVLKRSFEFGREGMLNDKVLGYSQAKFDQFMQVKGSVLRPEERESLKLIRESFVNYFKALADTMRAKVKDAVNKGNKQITRALSAKTPTDTFIELEKRKALSAIAEDLTTVTKAQASSAMRIISTESNNAYQDGRAQEILHKSHDPDPSVFKLPRPDACVDCIKAYLRGDHKTPKVFKLSELVANGSNVGKSHARRQPVVDSFHPHCACELHWLPPGFGFDSAGKMTYVGSGKV